MSIEEALERATEKLVAAQDTPQIVRAVCEAADIGEMAALVLARLSLRDAPGYLSGCDAFAAVRRSLDSSNTGGPIFPPAYTERQPAETRALLVNLATTLVERISAATATSDVPSLRDALAEATRAAGEALQALSGPVPDDADVR